MELIRKEYQNLVAGLAPAAIDISTEPSLAVGSQNVSCGRYFGLGPRPGMGLIPFRPSPSTFVSGRFLAKGMFRIGLFSNQNGAATFNNNHYFIFSKFRPYPDNNESYDYIFLSHLATGGATTARKYSEPYLDKFNSTYSLAAWTNGLFSANDKAQAIKQEKTNSVFSFVVQRLPEKKTPAKWLAFKDTRTTKTGVVVDAQHFGAISQSFRKDNMPAIPSVSVGKFSFKTGVFNTTDPVSGWQENAVSSYDINSVVLRSFSQTNSDFFIFRSNDFYVDSAAVIACVANNGASFFSIKDYQTQVFKARNGSPGYSNEDNGEVIWEGPTFKLDKTGQEFDVGTNTNTTTYTYQYLENGVLKKICWEYFPSYTGAALPLKAVSNQPWAIDKDTKGIFRANTVYEIAYSMYDKSLNHETNVGVPAKFKTGTDDFVSLTFYRNGQTPDNTTPAALAISGGILSPFVSPIVYGSRVLRNANHIEYRVYYRAEGETEWKPVYVIDAIRAHFDPTISAERIGKNPVALKTGGQPGGILDYSPIADDAWVSVVSYRDRVVWVSGKQLCFSLRNDFLSYPTNNYLACPKGQFYGAISHAYPGQAQQDSRLVVFGSDGVWVGRFRGPDYQQLQTIQVSADNAITIPVDGSDFALDSWTSSTAYSIRSVCVADGILYWWGPQGIYKDGGAELPERVSREIEPDIFQWIDQSSIEKMHAIYSAKTKEVIWFFVPSSTLSTKAMAALSYHTESGKFNHWFFDKEVTWSQEIEAVYADSIPKVAGGGTQYLSRKNRNNLSGKKVALGVEDYPIFFDDTFCGCTDFDKTKPVVTWVYQESPTVIRLYTDAYLPTGTKFLIKNYEAYTGDVFDFTNPPNAVHTVLSSGGPGYFTVSAGNYQWNAKTVLPGIGTDNEIQLPVYLENDAFPVKIELDFLAPFGVLSWVRFLYFHTWWKHLSVPNGNNQIVASWDTLIGSDTQSSRTLTLTSNSKNQNCQLYSQFTQDAQNGEGQAIRLKLEQAKHFGSYWVWQYLRLDCASLNLENIKMFEG